MTLEQIYFIASIAAAFAVVISIIFLALQIRMNTKAIRAESEYEAETRWADINFNLGSSKELAAFAMRHVDASLDPASLDPVELAQAGHFVRAMLQNYQSYYYLFRNGSLTQDAWQHHLVWARHYINLPIVQLSLERDLRAGLFRPEFLAELHREPAEAVDLSIKAAKNTEGAQ